MKFLLTAALLGANIFFGVLGDSPASEDDSWEDDDSPLRNGTRDGRLFPFVAAVKFGAAETCTAMSNGVPMYGSCRTQKQCDDQDGTVIAGSSCGKGYGVCCTFRLTCPQTTGNAVTVTTSGTHIVNPNTISNSMNNNNNEPTTCTINFRRPSSDYCQVRVDFVSLVMAGPNEQGECDRATVTVMADNLDDFMACGTLTGQHLYLQYGNSDTVSLNINPNTDGMPAPVYDIQPTFIRCRNSTACTRKPKSFKRNKDKNKNRETGTGTALPYENNPAPSGCDQYYTGRTGTVRSFNYVSSSGNGNNDPGQSQINSEMYMVCVETPPGASKIIWRTCAGETNPFDISGSTDDMVSLSGCNCTTDYVEFLGSPDGRYCGGAFPASVPTSASPFQMWVNFNKEEMPAINGPINPVIGCPLGYNCQDQYGIIITPPAVAPDFFLPCNTPEAIAAGESCILDPTLAPMVDGDNRGFCLMYTVV